MTDLNRELLDAGSCQGQRCHVLGMAVSLDHLSRHSGRNQIKARADVGFHFGRDIGVGSHRS